MEGLLGRSTGLKRDGWLYFRSTWKAPNNSPTSHHIRRTDWRLQGEDHASGTSEKGREFRNWFEDELAKPRNSKQTLSYIPFCVCACLLYVLSLSLSLDLILYEILYKILDIITIMKDSLPGVNHHHIGTLSPSRSPRIVPLDDTNKFKDKEKHMI